MKFIWILLLSASLFGMRPIATPEDSALLQFYTQLYEKNLSTEPHNAIPKVAHLIWLGPKEFPSSSIPYLKQWIALHPDWSFKFWTDVDRSPPCSGMEKQLLSSFTFQKLGDLYYHTSCVGERSHLLRYEILLQQGGLYFDHDVQPLQSLSQLHASYDFYCGLETPGPSLLSTAVYPNTHLIGSAPNHPILHATADWLLANWSSLATAYPGEEPEALQNRLMHRSLSALAIGIQKNATDKTVVFPANHFSENSPSSHSMALHHHAHTWLDRTSDEQIKITTRLHSMEKTSNILLFALAGLATLNGFTLFLLFRKRKSV